MGRLLERFCAIVDVIAAVLLGLCTILIVVSTASRYIFAWALPDAFDLSRLLIGACIMWGFASIGYRGGHIAVDLLWEVVSKRAQMIIDFIAWTMTFLFTALLAIMTYSRFTGAYRSNESTFDLMLPVWPVLGLIWLGCAVSVITVGFSISLLFKPARPHKIESQV